MRTPYWFEALPTKELRRLVAEARTYLAYAKAQGWDTQAHQTDFYQKRRQLRKRERAERKGTTHGTTNFIQRPDGSGNSGRAQDADGVQTTMTAAEAAAFFAAQPPDTPVVIGTIAGRFIEAKALLLPLVPCQKNPYANPGTEYEWPKPFSDQPKRECVLVGAG